MSKKTSEAWIAGQTVRVGLRVLKVRAVLGGAGDHRPGSFLLTNLAGALLYSFVPGRGLASITFERAISLLATSGILIEQAAPKAVQRAAYHAEMRRRINALEFDHV